ncbi:MAG: DUF6328 family protein [Streptosporangiaceae bacterium]
MTSTAETDKERLDRQLVELFQGLRVAVTGVQVLFAFLLTVPFSVGFEKLDALGLRLFFLSLVTAAIASISFIAPAAQHRVLFREGLKKELVHRSNRYGIGGTVALAISMSAACAVVVRAFWSHNLSVGLGLLVLLLCIWAWFVQPFLTLRRNHRV